MRWIRALTGTRRRSHMAMKFQAGEGAIGADIKDTLGASGKTVTGSWLNHLRVHPMCELFPPLPADELIALGDDIKANRLQNRIKLWAEKISEGPWYYVLDGRSRLDAMEKVGLPIQVFTDSKPNMNFFEVVEDFVDPFDYVVSANLMRRHMTNEVKRHVIAVRTSETRADSRGRNQPAHKPKPGPAPKRRTDSPLDGVQELIASAENYYRSRGKVDELGVVARVVEAANREQLQAIVDWPRFGGALKQAAAERLRPVSI